jgi:hypothetical protein
MAGIPLGGGQPIVYFQAIFADEVRYDRVAVADRLVGVDYIRKLADLEAVAVVIGNTEEFRVGVEGDHGVSAQWEAQCNRALR